MDEARRAAIARALFDTIPMIARVLDAGMRAARPPLAPPHFGLLRLLAHQPMAQSELGERLRVVPSTMSASIDALARHGWVERVRDTDDRRVIWIHISPAGREALETTARLGETVLGGLLAPLSDAELEQIEAGLKVLLQAFASLAPDVFDHVPPLPFMPPFPPPFPPPPD